MLFSTIYVICLTFHHLYDYDFNIFLNFAFLDIFTPAMKYILTIGC